MYRCCNLYGISLSLVRMTQVIGKLPTKPSRDTGVCQGIKGSGTNRDNYSLMEAPSRPSNNLRLKMKSGNLNPFSPALNTLSISLSRRDNLS